MEWLDNMNNAINYIESHLTDDISYDHAAKIAYCSTYHFQRMFSYITGVPLSEYIRHRRLTLAALELQTSDIKVIDVALKYGYECVRLGLTGDLIVMASNGFGSPNPACLWSDDPNPLLSRPSASAVVIFSMTDFRSQPINFLF